MKAAQNLYKTETSCKYHDFLGVVPVWILPMLVYTRLVKIYRYFNSDLIHKLKVTLAAPLHHCHSIYSRCYVTRLC